jgi:hypothetical protein
MRTIQYEQRGEKYKQTQTRLIRSLIEISRQKYIKIRLQG